MKKKENKQLSLKENQTKVRELREELLKLRVRKQMGQVEKPHNFRAIRREIARLLTSANQKNS